MAQRRSERPTPRFFSSAAKFRAWLERNHATATELTVGYYKKGSGTPSITYAEAVDQALCYGWIDGVVHRIDDASYMQRFTPRKASSNWSLVNMRKYAALLAAGEIRPAGAAAYARRTEARTGIYSFERATPAALAPAEAKQLAASRAAAAFFAAAPPSYQRAATHWVISAKRPETRARRLAELIATSAAGQRLKQFIPISTRSSPRRPRSGSAPAPTRPARSPARAGRARPARPRAR